MTVQNSCNFLIFLQEMHKRFNFPKPSPALWTKRSQLELRQKRGVMQVHGEVLSLLKNLILCSSWIFCINFKFWKYCLCWLSFLVLPYILCLRRECFTYLLPCSMLVNLFLFTILMDTKWTFIILTCTCLIISELKCVFLCLFHHLGLFS